MIKVPIHSHPFTTSRYYPMERLSIDFIGPYPDKGYVLTLIDFFTRLVELYYPPDAIGKSVAAHLFQHFGRFGAPTQLLSDRGSQFVKKNLHP
jgi:transposase InsO family protein